MKIDFKELVKMVEEVSSKDYQKSDRIKTHASRRMSTKGKTNKIRIFEVFQWEQKRTRDKKIELSPVFSEALELYRNNDLKTCRKVLKKYEKELPDDPVLQLYRNRCED